MKIKSIEWRNFQSYGNKLQKIDFEDSGKFFHVMGENGAGKSAISDVIKFGIYGRLSGKRLRDIPNRFNSQTYVKITLTKPGSTATIERGLAPNFLKLTINGVEYDQAGKKNVEEYIEEEIIGLPFYVFNNIVSLSINDFKSFLTMSPHDKRMIIDKIFSLEIINTAKYLVRDMLKELKENALSYEKQIESIQVTIDNSETELKQLQEKLKSNSQKKLQLLENNIQSYNEKLTEIASKLNNVETKLSEANTKVNDYNKLLNDNNSTLARITEKKKLYENQKCPTCESDLTTEFHKNILDDMIDKEVKVKENIKKLGEAITKIKDARTKLLNAQRSFDNKQTEFNTTVANIQKEINKIKESPESLETQSIEAIIEKSKENKRKALKQNDVNGAKTNFFKLVEDVFGDNGVKQMAINKIMPALNAEIRKVLAELSMDYNVTFNKSFDAKIMHLGYEVSIQQLSTGEKKKVDFSVLIAIIRLMKIRYSNVNVVFLDEIFASIDLSGIYHILKILADITKTLNMNIFVVNHAPLPSDVFDYKLHISKPNNFSTIEIEELI